MSRFLISAAHKSSGKTTVAIGIAAALRARGLAVQPFKKGPDYIDPMWLSLAAGRACRNLDFHVETSDEIRARFDRFSAGADVSLVEGNKGLYDGMDLEGSDSNAALAKLIDTAVVLVVDTRGMTRGIAPLVMGYRTFDRQVRFAGVILNHVGGSRHEGKLRAAVERYSDVPVLGALPRDPTVSIEERHLGLMPSNERTGTESLVARIAEWARHGIDLDRLLAIGGASRPAPVATASRTPVRLRLGIARDRAFGFYYPDDLEALEAAGAELVPFDTLADATLPDVDALFVGGGFPEMFGPELERNAGLRRQIRTAIESGMPAYAECGGLMYLARSLTANGTESEMVGVIPGDVVMHSRPIGRGYARLAVNPNHPWAPAGIEVPCHEFHYSSLENTDAGLNYAYDVARGYGVDGRRDGIVRHNLLASYSHLRSTERFSWAQRFVDWAVSRGTRKAGHPQAQNKLGVHP